MSGCRAGWRPALPVIHLRRPSRELTPSLHGVRTLTDREMYWCGGIARINRPGAARWTLETIQGFPALGTRLFPHTQEWMSIMQFKNPQHKKMPLEPSHPVYCNASTQERAISVFSMMRAYTHRTVQCGILFICVYETALSSWMLNVDKLIFLSRLSASETSGQTTANIQTENKLKEQKRGEEDCLVPLLRSWKWISAVAFLFGSVLRSPRL